MRSWFQLTGLMVLVSLNLGACSTFNRESFVDYQNVPGNTLVREAPALYEKILYKLHERVEESFHCSNWEILDTTVSHTVGALTFDQLGEIVNGVVVEEWLIDSCGVQRYIDVVYVPWQDGSLVVVPKA